MMKDRKDFERQLHRNRSSIGHVSLCENSRELMFQQFLTTPKAPDVLLYIYEFLPEAEFHKGMQERKSVLDTTHVEIEFNRLKAKFLELKDPIDEKYFSHQIQKTESFKILGKIHELFEAFYKGHFDYGKPLLKLIDRLPANFLKCDVINNILGFDITVLPSLGYGKDGIDAQKYVWEKHSLDVILLELKDSLGGPDNDRAEKVDGINSSPKSTEHLKELENREPPLFSHLETVIYCYYSGEKITELNASDIAKKYTHSDRPGAGRSLLRKLNDFNSKALQTERKGYLKALEKVIEHLPEEAKNEATKELNMLQEGRRANQY